MVVRETKKLSNSNKAQLIAAIKSYCSENSSEKVKNYVGKFFDSYTIGNKVFASVKGNHGKYKVSIEVSEKNVNANCSCYIGENGCHHCLALGLTFIANPSLFREIEQKNIEDINSLEDINIYLSGITLDSLLKKLKANGITQKAFSENIGMNSRHLSSIKSSESRNRYYNELGATKLACLWILEHFNKNKS